MRISASHSWLARGFHNAHAHAQLWSTTVERSKVAYVVQALTTFRLPLQFARMTAIDAEYKKRDDCQRKPMPGGNTWQYSPNFRNSY